MVLTARLPSQHADLLQMCCLSYCQPYISARKALLYSVLAYSQLASRKNDVSAESMFISWYTVAPSPEIYGLLPDQHKKRLHTAATWEFDCTLYGAPLVTMYLSRTACMCYFSERNFANIFFDLPLQCKLNGATTDTVCRQRCATSICSARIDAPTEIREKTEYVFRLNNLITPGVFYCATSHTEMLFLSKVFRLPPIDSQDYNICAWLQIQNDTAKLPPTNCQNVWLLPIMTKENICHFHTAEMQLSGPMSYTFSAYVPNSENALETVKLGL